MNIKIPRFPQDPVYGQVYNGHTYINGEWLESYNDADYRLYKHATLEALKEYERLKDMLQKTATQVMMEDLPEKIENAQKSQKEFVDAIEYVLRGCTLNELMGHRHISILYKFLLDNKPSYDPRTSND